MRSKILVLYILCLALSLASLSACTGETAPPVEGTTESDAPVDTSPVDPVILPDAETVLGAAFDIPVSAEKDFVCVPAEGGVCVTGYTGDATRVSLPDRIAGERVVAIGDGAFAEHTALTSLVLPACVERIGKGILAGCTSLTALKTPLLGENSSKAQYLGYLFGSERYEDNPRDVPASLETLCIFGAWETLPAYALYDCNDLTFLSLPSTVHTLEKFSVSRCASLTAIDGLSSVRVLGEHALSYCESLEALTLGESVHEIGFSALEGCDSLRTLTVPFVGGSATEHTYLGYIFGAAYPDFAKGYYPAALSRVEVLGGKTLGTNAFFECTTLREVVLPAGLETVGVRAFYRCDALWSITLPDTVTAVRESAFLGCDALLEVHLGTSLSALGVNAFQFCDSLTAITLPDTLASLPASVFSGCSSLSSVDLGGVRTVGAQAFRGCTALTDVRAGGEVNFGEGNEVAEKLLNTNG